MRTFIEHCKNILLFAVVALLTSCGSDDFFSAATSVYCDHSCNFVFDYTLHPSEILKSSISGQCGFCKVYKGADNGVQKVYVEKYGETDEYSPYAYDAAYGEEKVANLVIGYKNGLLLGYSALELSVMVYDLCCPTCENLGGKLEWNGSSTSVKCPVCKKVYDLNSTGTGLNRYPATLGISSIGTNYIRVVKN